MKMKNTKGIHVENEKNGCGKWKLTWKMKKFYEKWKMDVENETLCGKWKSFTKNENFLR